MNSIQIETFAVNAVKDSILMSDYLTPFINDNDKEPSWDGTVYIYKNKDCTKDNLKGRLPVQIKGKESDDLTKDEISYAMSVVDLNNYLDDGGAILFVVYIGNGGLCKKIYYIALTPIKLRIELGTANGQKTKTLKLKEFPTDNNKKVAIFLNCYENCRRQASFSDATLLPLEELQEQGVLEGITVPFSTIGTEDLNSALLNSEVYVYANIKGSSIPQPLEMIPQDIHTQEIKPADISIGEKNFYSSVEIIRNAKQTQCILGESLSIILDDKNIPCNIIYRSSDKVRVMAKDLEFIVTNIEEGYFLFNGRRFNFNCDNADLTNFDLEQQKDNLQTAKEIVQLLDMLGCDKDISVKDLSESDRTNLNILIRGLIYKESIKLKLQNPAWICICSIGKLNFKIYLIPDKDEADKFYLSDFFQTEVPVYTESKTGEAISVSQFSILKKTDLICLDNIRFEALLPSFQKVYRNDETINSANHFFLELLLAYDESKKQILLETAEEFSKWLCEFTEDELPYAVKEINRLQVIKRKRNFNSEEVKKIYSMIEDTNATDLIRAAGYLLLELQPLAKIHYERLDDTLKEEFKRYPIYHFWKPEEN